MMSGFQMNVKEQWELKIKYTSDVAGHIEKQ